MKTAKELIIPFPWEERRVERIEPNFLYIPGQIPHQENRHTFFDSLKANIEFCSGTGQWIVEKAKANPNVGWIAVEKKFERAKKIWQKSEKENLTNLMVICSDASDFVRFYSPNATQIFVNFPDPWPKRRHMKHRLIQVPFLKDLHNINVERATCATDDPAYAKQMLVEFKKCSEWKLDFHINEWPEYGSSFFESLWKSKGKVIHYLSFVRSSCT